MFRLSTIGRNIIFVVGIIWTIGDKSQLKTIRIQAQMNQLQKYKACVCIDYF